jgi:hypothetical protein
MKYPVIILTILCVSCGGSLSSEQRKKIRENMEAKSIKKISEADLTEAALAYARKITKIVESHRPNDRHFLDSLQTAYDVQILFIHVNDPGLRAVEKQVIEAYASVADSPSLGDNIQKMGGDSLLYTKPMMRERPDGSVEFSQALGLRLHKKPIILSIKE